MRIRFKSFWLLGALTFAGTWAQAFLTPQVQARQKKSSEHLYNLDYVQTRSELRELIRENPDNPFGYLFEAGAIWWQATTEFGLFKDTPTLEGLFQKDVHKGLELSRALFDSPEKSQRADAYFVAGMLLGLHGQWNLARGHWLKAYFNGKKAIKYLKKCVKIDPEYHDAYLGLGIFDYHTDRLPGILKIPALLMVRGNAQRGKERIQQAMEKGRTSSHQAALFLLTIYLVDEQDYERALPLLRSLRQTYPSSAYFHFLEILTLYRMKDWENSHRQALALFQRAQQDSSLLGRKQLSILCGLTGPECLDKKNLESTIHWFTRAIDASTHELNSWRALCHLYRGLAQDMLGNRAMALTDYGQALAQPRGSGIRERAEYCLRQACSRQEVEKMLKQLALEDISITEQQIPAHPKAQEVPEPDLE